MKAYEKLFNQLDEWTKKIKQNEQLSQSLQIPWKNDCENLTYELKRKENESNT
jgi:hypothetical protein